MNYQTLKFSFLFLLSMTLNYYYEICDYVNFKYSAIKCNIHSIYNLFYFTLCYYIAIIYHMPSLVWTLLEHYDFLIAPAPNF